eukprot:2010785-Pleurochrysis_carterae.AAC.1
MLSQPRETDPVNKLCLFREPSQTWLPPGEADGVVGVAVRLRRTLLCGSYAGGLSLLAFPSFS